MGQVHGCERRHVCREGDALIGRLAFTCWISSRRASATVKTASISSSSLLLGEKRLVAPLRVHCLRLFRLRDPFLAARLRCDLFLVVDAMVVSVHVGLPFD